MLNKILNKTIIVGITLLNTTLLFAQIPVDGFYPKKNSFVIAASYDYKSFDNFYAGDEVTDENPVGLGEITTSVASIYAQYAITDKISATVTLPYINTSSESNVDPIQQSNNESGLQDLGFFLKGLVHTKRFANFSRISLGGAFGVTVPVSDYNGAGVLSLGSSATSLKSQAIFLYETPLRIFTEFKVGSSLYTSSDFNIPSALLYNLKLGYIHKRFYTHAEISMQNSISGFDIGSEEFVAAGALESLPETEIDFTKFIFTFYVPIYEEIIGISGNFLTTLDGKNTPNETSFGGGLVYNFK